MEIMIKKIRSLSPQLKVSFWFTFSNIVTNGIAYLTLPIFTRLLSVEEYGIITIFNSWNSIAMIVVTLNLSSGVFLTAYAKYKGNRDEIISSFQGLVTTISLIVLAVYFSFREQINRILGLNTLLVVLLIFECVMTASYNMWAMKLKYEFKYKLLVALSVLTALLNPAIGILLIKILENGANAKILAGAIVQFLLFGWIYVRNFCVGKHFWSKTFWWYAIGFGVPLIPHYLSLVVLNQSDRLMISNICGEAEAGIYGIGYSISCVINMILAGINTAFGPWIMQKIKEKEYSIIRKKTVILLGFVLVLCLLVISIEPELLKIAATPEYYRAMWVMPPITIGLFFSYLNNTFARVEFYYEKKYFIAFFSIFAAMINITLNLLFIPKYGMIAAGYTTLVSYLILSILHYLLYKLISKKEMKGAILFDGKIIFIMGVIAVIISFIMILLINYWIIRYLIVFIVMGVLLIKHKVIISFFK